MVNNLMREPLSYQAGGVTCIGQLIWDANVTTPRPGVLVAPAFGGLGPFEIEQAEQLAALGYVALAVDYYGDGQRVETMQESSALMQALMAQRPALAHRMNAALSALKSQAQVDPDRTAAIGYCLGGKAVLDLARSGADLCGVVPIHGVFDRPPGEARAMIASVLALHGWADPLATPDQLVALTQELDAVCEDWQVLAFGKTGHSFTNPHANDPERGLAYDDRSNRRAWAALTAFLAEKLT
ncbi:MAG: dienelactone hydrolase [Paracoccaceae bacterium]|jgi:dienelactone hydrolase